MSKWVILWLFSARNYEQRQIRLLTSDGVLSQMGLWQGRQKYGGDFHAKNINSYSHCLHLMFGQMAGCKSLKDISLVLKSLKRSVYHLGIPTAVDSSSLSKANEARDYRIFEELGLWLINKVRPMYAKENIPNVYLPGWEIFAIDSTTIPCSIKLLNGLLANTRKEASRCIPSWICEEAYRIHLCHG